MRRITLFLFGGVANIEREPDTPATEFWMAIVGPLTSILLGLFFTFFATLLAGLTGAVISEPLGVMARLGPLATLLFWLGPVIIMVGLFNLIPGFPLDGGRILRSMLWAVTKDLRKATRWAAGAGHLVAWFLILSGVAMTFGARIPLLGTGFINGLWMIFLGWFLNSAAGASYGQIVIQDLLEDVPVERLMRQQGPVVPPEMLVSELVYHWLLGTEGHAFPVMAGNEMVGIVCLQDVRRVPREVWEQTLVGEIMTPADKLAVVTPGADASEALKELERRDVRQVPVLDNGHLVGMLRRRDIVKWLQLQSPQFASNQSE